MAQAGPYTFEFKELAALMVKSLDLHEGLWSVYVEFGIGAANVGPTKEEVRPTALVPIVRFGLTPATEESAITVDASVVNPKP